jgi:hypothetical protein
MRQGSHLMTRSARRALAGLLLTFVALGFALGLGLGDAAATPPASGPVQPADAGVANAPVESANVTIVFATSPPATAMVTWGRKRLGKITPGKPLVVVRPRDSGPLDVMIRPTNYLPVQTRAHTFSDHRVIVKLTPPENKSELLGYRAPLDAGVETPEQAAALNAIAGADGGVTPVVPTFQVVPMTTPAQGPWLVP